MFQVDNIFVVFTRKVFQQIIGISCPQTVPPLLADIFLYSYEAEFIQSLLSAGRKLLASQFNFPYTYTSMTYCPLIILTLRIISVRCIPWAYIKDTTESNTSASYLDLLLSIGREVNFALPFTTSVTSSILQTFCSRVATSHLRPPMAFYLPTHPIRHGLLLICMFYSESGATF